MGGIAFGLYFNKINLAKSDFRTLFGFWGLLAMIMRLFLINFIFTGS